MSIHCIFSFSISFSLLFDNANTKDPKKILTLKSHNCASLEYCVCPTSIRLSFLADRCTYAFFCLFTIHTLSIYSRRGNCNLFLALCSVEIVLLLLRFLPNKQLQIIHTQCIVRRECVQMPARL